MQPSGNEQQSVSLLGRNLLAVPAPGRWGAFVRTLDLSENLLKDLVGIEQFPQLTTLTVDSNRLTAYSVLPKHEKLEVLWVS